MFIHAYISSQPFYPNLFVSSGGQTAPDSEEGQQQQQRQLALLSSPADLEMESAADLDRHSNRLRLQESRPKFLTIEVLSSKSKVSVTVDGTTVSTRSADHCCQLAFFNARFHKTDIFQKRLAKIFSFIYRLALKFYRLYLLFGI